MAAPLSNQGTSPQLAQPPAEKGWVETGVLLTRDLVVYVFRQVCDFFKKIFPCLFNKEATQAALSMAGQPMAQSSPALVEPAPRLTPELEKELKLLNGFKRLETSAQERILNKIGQQSARWYSTGSVQQIGAALIQARPTLLEKYIIL